MLRAPRITNSPGAGETFTRTHARTHTHTHTHIPQAHLARHPRSSVSAGTRARLRTCECWHVETGSHCHPLPLSKIRRLLHVSSELLSPGRRCPDWAQSGQRREAGALKTCDLENAQRPDGSASSVSPCHSSSLFLSSSPPLSRSLPLSSSLSLALLLSLSHIRTAILQGQRGHWQPPEPSNERESPPHLSSRPLGGRCRRPQGARQPPLAATWLLKRNQCTLHVSPAPKQAQQQTHTFSAPSVRSSAPHLRASPPSPRQ